MCNIFKFYKNNSRVVEYKKGAGFTLIELMLVVLIFTILFSAILTVLSTSDRSWRVSQNKLAEQQEARRAMDNIVKLLRQSSPSWGVYIGSSYTGSTQNKIQFNIDAAGRTIMFKLYDPFRPSPPRQLTKYDKQSCSDLNNPDCWKPVAQEIESITFSGGDCSDCNCDFTNPGCSDCASVTNTCPLVRIEIKTKREKGFTLVSYVTLRNYAVPGTAEPPAEGEF